MIWAVHNTPIYTLAKLVRLMKHLGYKKSKYCVDVTQKRKEKTEGRGGAKTKMKLHN